MFSIWNTESPVAQQLCELQASTAPGSPFSRHIETVRSASDKSADMLQLERSTVIVGPQSSHKSASDLHCHLPAVPPVSGEEVTQREVPGVMSPEADLLLKLVALGSEEIKRMGGIQEIATAMGMPHGILNPYIGDDGKLTRQGEAVIHSDAIIRWRQLTTAQRSKQGMKVFCDLYGIEQGKFLRSVSASGQLTLTGVLVMGMAGYIFHFSHDH